MCRDAEQWPCGDPAHHPELADGYTPDGPNPAVRWGQRPRDDSALPPRAYPDAGPILGRAAPRSLDRREARARQPRGPRRPLLGGLVTLAATACAASAGAAAPPVSLRQETPPTAAPEPAATPAPTPPPEPTPIPTPPDPALTPLGVEQIVQPFFAADGSRVLYYDQGGRPGGTWAAGAAAGTELVRPQWGYYVAGDTLLAAARPARRDTYVLHTPSGREWSLPTTNSTVFSPEGTWVAYSVSATGQPGGAPPSPGQGFSGTAAAFQLTTITVSWADGQEARRVQLPINGSVLAWLPAPDGTLNNRLLLTGKRAEADDPSLWAFDLRDRSLIELARSYRLTGVLPSPDGTWVAHAAMWNSDPAQNGVWVTRTDGSLRRRVNIVGGYRWTSENCLIMIPHRGGTQAAHEVWEVSPADGTARRLTDAGRLPFRVANYDWDVSQDGTQLVFVSADDKRLWHLSLPRGMALPADASLPEIPAPSPAGGSKYRLPFATPPGPHTWYVAQWYGVTTGGYRGRNSTYVQGQGIHFGIDFATRCGTPVVAVAPGRVIAVDGDFGSPPHNVVIQLDDGNIAMYGHLVERTRHVQVGDRVAPGQVVGNSGDSIAPYNCTRNPHLHLEIRKQGRATATNPVRYFDTNWDDMSLGVYPGPRFERNLDDPRKYQFLDDQPDIYFGGPIITNFARAWPP